jgi:ribonuclease G
MSKEMIVSVNGREKKIAILENGRVTEFYIERGEENSGVAGNVYKGRVMRVLPGMQSAFVDIGLERDAFLYVSDFFDEEEEIERIVTEKGKKVPAEEAKREARDQVERLRLEREKHMDGAQEIAEPISEAGVELDVEPSLAEGAPEPEKPRRGRGRGGRKAEEQEQPQSRSRPFAEDGDDVQLELTSVVEAPVFEIDTSGFERIGDDEDTGDMFKDAYLQEAIVDRVRAAEFDMESTAEAPVGSLIKDVTSASSGFERIADEEESPQPKRGRSKAKVESKTRPNTKAATKEKAAKKQSSRKKKTADDAGGLEDAQASVSSDTGDIADMAVRRGGRGRRRGGKGKPKGNGEEGSNGDEHLSDAPNAADGGESAAPAIEAEPVEEAPSEAPETAPNEPAPSSDGPRSNDRDRGRRGRGGRDRNDRGENRNDRGDRPSGGGDRPSGSDRPSTDRGDRPYADRGGRRERPPQPAISDLLKEGQEILVQIAKEPIAKKGARITSHIALPGRYLVYMPTIEHLGVSRKIESANERSRLRQMLQKIRQDPDIPSGGFIVRTAGVGIAEEDLHNDAKFLARSWADNKKASEKKKSPALIHQDLDLVQRLLRDQLSDSFTAIRVDSEEEYLATVEFMNRMAPKLVNRVKLYTRDEPILDYYGVQEEIDKALKPRVWLKSGGYLVINQTEALVAIDVNTGKFVGKGNQRLEDTITRTNMEAVDEIARQIRLRDLGGIIVLDLIDMEDRRNRHKVSGALQEALQHDKSPTKVLSFNDFGLIIMTRKRVKQSLERTMCSPCENCEGSGWVKSATTVCYEILAEARRLSKQLEDVRHTTLRVHPEVSRALRNEERDVMFEIEAYLGNVDISADKAVHQGQFDFAFV